MSRWDRVENQRLLQERISMGGRYAPSGPGWLVLGLLLSVNGAAQSSLGSPVPAGQAEGNKTEMPTPRDDKDAKPVSEEIVEAISALRHTDIRNSKGWATAARKLAQIGKPAVPALIEELDRTTENRPLRSLGFTIRAIGDPRAVPALIRAIPRTLVPAGSDFLLKMDDPDLLAFLQQHDLHKGADGQNFTFGMPYREITGALHAITGQRFNEDELNFINLQGTPKQRWLQRWLFHGLAQRWAVWWKQNWKKFTDDPACSRVSLPLLPDAPPVAAATADQPFPTGDNVRVSSGWAQVIVGPPQPQEYYRTFKDLDTGRESKWPKELPELKKATVEEVAAFAAKEGLDIRGIDYTPPGSNRSYYAIQGLGLRAWQVENSLYDTIASDLKANKLPSLDRPTSLLMDLDPKTKTYYPENEATFLFVTHDGTTGVLQVTNLVTELFSPDDFGKPVEPKLSRGFFRGVKFQYKFLLEDGNEGE
jgi:hypothetical protein